MSEVISRGNISREDAKRGLFNFTAIPYGQG
jgi:hypothetical protein